jgi:hypothetical protein
MLNGYMTDVEKAWLAGFFDGEGCITTYYHDKRLNKDGSPRRELDVRLDISQVDRTPLDRIVFLTGVGKVKPKPRSKIFKAQQGYAWILNGASQIRVVLEEILPFTIVKTSQIRVALELLATYQHRGRRKMPDGVMDNRLVLASQLKVLKRLHY